MCVDVCLVLERYDVIVKKESNTLPILFYNHPFHFKHLHLTSSTFTDSAVQYVCLHCLILLCIIAAYMYH